MAAAGAPARRGPATALAAERARQVRMTVVGPVTERWAPEQAVPVHENWQLAAPIGPATDLWALGALLFRAVQGARSLSGGGRPPSWCSSCARSQPAFAEECGPLRPVVESLLRQDPTERLDFEELRGWLRSLVRSAPEPEAGAHVVATPPTDPRRLPIVRRRGELVRRRRAGLPADQPARAAQAGQAGGHRVAPAPRPDPAAAHLPAAGRRGRVRHALPAQVRGGHPGAGQGDKTGAAGDVSPAPSQSSAPASSQPQPDQTSPAASNTPSNSAGSTETQTGSNVADGFVLRKDSVGFQIAVAKGWTRTPKNGSGQVVYSHGDFELIVVAGRDSGASSYGSDPMVYQRDNERELQPHRDSSWATATGACGTITVGGKTMAEGQFHLGRTARAATCSCARHGVPHQRPLPHRAGARPGVPTGRGDNGCTSRRRRPTIVHRPTHGGGAPEPNGSRSGAVKRTTVTKMRSPWYPAGSLSRSRSLR
ncbi:hypothetical protein ACRAWF_46355 [Streptomyces sp. L7]